MQIKTTVHSLAGEPSDEAMSREETAITTPTAGPTMPRILANFAFFQACWLVCVMGGAAGRPWLGVAMVALVVTLHLRWATRPLIELSLLLSVGAIGAVWDGLLAGFGWLVYPSGHIIQWVAPSWIIAMWVGFAMTLNVSLRWLRGRYTAAFFLGLIGGPLAFLAGARLGGVVFPDPVIALSALAAGWSVITPSLVWLASRLDGYTPAPVDSVPTRRPAPAEAS